MDPITIGAAILAGTKLTLFALAKYYLAKRLHHILRGCIVGIAIRVAIGLLILVVVYLVSVVTWQWVRGTSGQLLLLFWLAFAILLWLTIHFWRKTRRLNRELKRLRPPMARAAAATGAVDELIRGPHAPHA